MSNLEVIDEKTVGTVFNMLKEIQQEIIRLQSLTVTDATLWDRSDVAGYLKISQKTLHNHKVFERSDFPRAIAVPISSDGAPTKRWKAQEVIAWAQKIREVRPGRK